MTGFKKLGLVIGASILLLACSRDSAIPKVEPAVPATASAIPVISLQVNSPEPTVVPPASDTPEPTARVEPTPTPEPTPTQEPTPTPEPFVLVPIPVTLRTAGGYERTSRLGILYRAEDGSYAAYGQFGSGDIEFYPADEKGTVPYGTEPLSHICAVPAYTPEEAPKQDGAWMLAVYIKTQSIVAYHAEQGEWIEQRVMICSTGRKGHDTPTGHFKITDRYEYKLLGTEESPCYGLWACRFKGHCLFHSVPINAAAGRDKEKAHSMTTMSKYEKLGNVASDGCIRLTVIDAKWIYDLSDNQTVEVWVMKKEGPIPTKPPAVIWEEPYTNKKGLGWDPTDPHPDNPYHNASSQDSKENSERTN